MIKTLARIVSALGISVLKHETIVQIHSSKQKKRRVTSCTKPALHGPKVVL